jgi:iron(II)-dependent oxidoreductase
MAPKPRNSHCDRDETPGSTETVAAFVIGMTPVTVEAYDRGVNAGGCKAKEPMRRKRCNSGVSGRDKHPVNCVTWNQAQDFCLWIGGRLATALVWEDAAKRGESRFCPWGNGPPTLSRARFQSDDRTIPAGSLPAVASKFGLLHMSGNVSQWSSTMHRHDLEIRGGGFGEPESNIHASKRNSESSSDRDVARGFRCCL